MKDHKFEFMASEFERLTGIKKPEKMRFRYWVVYLFKRGKIPFTKTDYVETINHTPPAKKIKKPTKSDREQQYVDYIKSPRWAAFRKKAFAALGRICAKCGSSKDLHIHHLHYKTFMNERIEDVMVLCEPCHVEEHRRWKQYTPTTTFYPDRKINIQ